MNQEPVKSITEMMDEISTAVQDFVQSLPRIEKYRKISGYNFPRDLRYGYDMNEDQIIFIMSKNSFKTFEYYQGFEYERSHIAWKLELDGDVIVAYSEDSARAMKLIQHISEVEEEI